ncbi:hypothetical protein SAMN05518672_101273 [Chitinophaga sp. CF118]|nr:hypothetical protein SAMN05518672_101273 [Chitinophaga sp. CF118]
MGHNLQYQLKRGSINLSKLSDLRLWGPGSLNLLEAGFLKSGQAMACILLFSWPV